MLNGLKRRYLSTKPLKPQPSAPISIATTLRWWLFFCLISFLGIIRGMMNNYSNDKEIRGGCCGRSMAYTAEPKCGQSHCCFNEYDYKMNACIRKKQPDCTAQAVIPAVTIETIDGLTNYRNAFVHVTSNNTTYYVDDKGTPMITWQGDVEANLPDNVQTQEEWEEFLKSFKLKGQFLYLKFRGQDFDNDLIDSFYFSNSGKIYFAGEFEDTGIGG